MSFTIFDESPFLEDGRLLLGPTLPSPYGFPIGSLFM
jgi:hypothetical protein